MLKLRAYTHPDGSLEISGAFGEGLDARKKKQHRRGCLSKQSEPRVARGVDGEP